MLTLLQSVFYSGICLVLFALLFLPALVSLVVCAVYFLSDLFQRFQGRGWPQDRPCPAGQRETAFVAIRSEKALSCSTKTMVGWHSSSRDSICILE